MLAWDEGQCTKMHEDSAGGALFLPRLLACQAHDCEEGCRTYDYSSWDLNEEQVVTSLEDLDYHIYLSTYYYSKEVALNVSFETTSKDVHGFDFSLLEYKFPGTGEKYETCRLFDLRKSMQQSASVFYDCYFKIRGDYDNKYFFVTSRGLPTNRVARFFVTLSTSPLNSGGETVCNWESTVMVLEPALLKKSVIAQFGLADVKYNITRYNISLWSRDSTIGDAVAQEQVIEVKSGSMGMGTVSFTGVAAGTYYLRMHPQHTQWVEHSCIFTMTDIFTVPEDNRLKLALSISLSCVLGLLVALVVASLIYFYIKKRAVPARRSATVFLLYSYDSAIHFEAVQALYQFLSKVPGLRVVFDVEKHMRPAHEHHPWGDLVTPAIYDIVRLPDLQQKLVKVLMSGTPETNVPTSLFTRGVTFKLPKHTSRMLHHLFGEHQCRSTLQCMARHPLWPDADCERAFRKKLEGLELLKSI
ncbi:hypothetical protein HPB49_023431 [Dermacentor silvarum]|uniref:Uncharacterized protein n=1 Tax=Dermacentor silvarum TaxID=543639 RepID=A0ACB8CN92_DERSI|nr:hypothetical protein HPB49_023431 [Dermacentor silvarum]